MIFTLTFACARGAYPIITLSSTSPQVQKKLNLDPLPMYAQSPKEVFLESLGITYDWPIKMD